MCKSRAQGGQRCAGYARTRLAEVSPDSPAWETLAAQYASTPEGETLLTQRGHEAAKLGDYDTEARYKDVVARGLRIRRTNLDVAARFAAETDRLTPTSTPSTTPLGQDTVQVASYGTMHRLREGVYAGTPYAMRFEANRPITDDEMHKMASLIGYRYRAAVHGEPMDYPQRDSTHSFVVAADTTKSASDDLGMALDDFEGGLTDFVKDGSPVRKTDRAGAGTKGTRLLSTLR